jgi:Alw26I/Eco31I/Esp3I family type II restriction m6 adenine DNA methyltransferase
MKNENLFNLLLFYEESLMREFLLEITSKNPTQENFTEKDLVQYNLIRKDKFNPTVLAHQFLIQNLVDFAFCHFFESENQHFKIYDFDFLPKQSFDTKNLKKIAKNDFAEILENLHINFLNSEFTYQNGKLRRVPSKINLKESGSVYTQSEIAQTITLQTIENKILQGKSVETQKILDFGCGTGRFYWSAFQILNEKFGMSKTEIIKNLYAIDSNEMALAILKIKILLEVGLEYWEIINQNILERNMLIVKNGLNFQENNYLDLENDFQEVLQNGGFDVIISNPPYFLLKINQNNSKDIFYKKYYTFLSEKINSELQYFRNSGIYQYSIEGMINYYKLSIEMMLRICKMNGEIGIICPSTLFGDVSSAKLRKFILEKNQLRKLEFFEEKAKLFENISQATAIFYLSKGQKTQNIEIKIDEKPFEISFDLIKNTFSENLEIPQMEEIGWGILKKLNHFKKVKEFKNLRNRRGEFDLLQFKNLITNQETGFRLVRGNMINSTQIDYDKQNEFVKIEEFKKVKSQEFLRYDFQKVRLVCQQISNIDIPKRLKFVPCSENDILANSCNYIAINDLIQIKNLQTLLNSHLLNWRFKVTSTNNHINNYELDELPLIDFTLFSPSMNGNELKNNVEIAKEYGLNSTEILYILQDFFPKNEIEHYL